MQCHDKRPLNLSRAERARGMTPFSSLSLPFSHFISPLLFIERTIYITYSILPPSLSPYTLSPGVHMYPARPPVLRLRALHVPPADDLLPG